jgi:RimJ/RimL family protein N-acetyltransferase
MGGFTGLVFGDELRPMLEVQIGPITDESMICGRFVDGKPVCLFAFTNLRRGDVEISAWAVPGGISRAIIRALAEYAFVTLGVRRVSARAVESNTDSQRALIRAGFVHEGTLRSADNGENVQIFGLLPEELRYGKLTKTPEAR